MNILSSILITLALYQGQMTTDYILNDSVFSLMLPLKMRYEFVEKPVESTYDPRNLTKPSELESHNIDKLIEGTQIEGMGYTFIQAEKESKINALFLLALTKQESHWGNSNFGMNRNNLTGYNAQTLNPSRARSFNTKDENVLETAKLLNEQYLNKSGLYYRGLSIYNVNTNYCQDKDNKPLTSWSTNINSIAKTLGNNIHNTQKGLKLVDKRIKLGDN